MLFFKHVSLKHRFGCFIFLIKSDTWEHVNFENKDLNLLDADRNSNKLQEDYNTPRYFGTFNFVFFYPHFALLLSASASPAACSDFIHNIHMGGFSILLHNLLFCDSPPQKLPQVFDRKV